MIQRIQTVYLIIVVALSTAMLFMPLAVVQIDSLLYSFEVTGLNTMTSPSELVFTTWALMALSILICIVAFKAIFLFKKRMLQIRLCIFNAILLIGFYGLFAFFCWKIPDLSSNFHFSSVRVALLFPFISLILTYLAIHNIGVDEMLVRSLNRLRK